MPTRRGRRIVFSWIALVALLLITFAPVVTGALSTSSGLPWDRICSAANVAADRHGTPGAPAAPTAPHAFEHCPYCALHADLAPPPDPRLADAGTALAFRTLPVAFTRAPRGNAVWLSAQPRAPPRFV
jgi:hypothetical protein